eukprot:NODE_7251_length_599_cov_50.991525_g7228_i0.p1 GENE.NODE_7251_length_599_cov_50.991525_g7228_i0~~NODE_7251_length_599_cov_50.991525_g7228_i0.p1  ORF type:complete len:132 (+),score=19.40 NODE_7251_length_599_cov_50.991525_g7228_i0:88-483(+)
MRRIAQPLVRKACRGVAVQPPYPPVECEGKGAHMTIGYYTPKEGVTLDELIQLYKEKAFNVLKDHPDLHSMSVAKDVKTGRMISVSTWTSFEKAVTAMMAPEFKDSITAMKGALAPEPPDYRDVPVVYTKH